MSALKIEGIEDEGDTAFLTIQRDKGGKFRWVPSAGVIVGNWGAISTRHGQTPAPTSCS